MCELGWKSLGVLELTALPSIDEEHWVWSRRLTPCWWEAAIDAVRRGEGLSLVAAEQDQIVGHVMFSPYLLDAPKRLLPVQVLSRSG
jgi:predicted N-acetyltransferase YhbS